MNCEENIDTVNKVPFRKNKGTVVKRVPFKIIIDTGNGMPVRKQNHS